MDETGNNTEQIIFTDKNKLFSYNKKLLKSFVKFLNKKHKKTLDVIYVGTKVQVAEDEKLDELITEFTEKIRLH